MVLNTPAEERKKRVTALLKAVGMIEQKDKYPDQISAARSSGSPWRGRWSRTEARPCR